MSKSTGIKLMVRGGGMREIKFRAWDTEEKRYLKPIDTASMVLRFISGRVTDGGLNCPHIELQQYTGLKDKNGVEIYEGDILKAKRHNFEDYDICVIKYLPISYVFEVQHYNGNYTAPRNWHQHFEVIGNIYENQELLGAQ